MKEIIVNILFMHFVGGTLGGMSGVLASYPLDAIKINANTRYFQNLL